MPKSDSCELGKDNLNLDVLAGLFIHIAVAQRLKYN